MHYWWNEWFRHSSLDWCNFCQRARLRKSFSPEKIFRLINDLPRIVFFTEQTIWHTKRPNFSPQLSDELALAQILIKMTFISPLRVETYLQSLVDNADLKNCRFEQSKCNELLATPPWALNNKFLFEQNRKKCNENPLIMFNVLRSKHYSK